MTQRCSPSITVSFQSLATAWLNANASEELFAMTYPFRRLTLMTKKAFQPGLVAAWARTFSPQ
jgi:hypothetical protein